MKITLFLMVAFATITVHAQTTRIPPPKETLGTYVIDTGPGLDSGCTYRSGGPLLIDVPVPPVVNSSEIGADGFLKDPAKLIASKVIGATAYIRFPAYDVDDKATGLTAGQSPEVDKISFNGKKYGTGVLAGFNNKWAYQQFEVPISELKFIGGVNGIIKNQLRIDIDTANVGVGELWCTAVDWVAVQIDVAAPYVLAHGIASSAATWDESDAPGVITYLNRLGIRWTRFSVEPSGSAIGNGDALATNVASWLAEMKADRVHLIGHSKGGLDAQAMAAQTQKFKILSLSTLSTPHMGSVVSDLTILELRKKDENLDAIQNNSPDPNGYVNVLLNQTWAAVAIGQAPKKPGLSDLRTSAFAEAFSRGFRGNISPTYSIGASADANNDGSLNASEANGMPGGGLTTLFNSSWNVMRLYSSAALVRIVTTPGRVYGTNRTLEFSTTPAATPQDNDIVVSQASANPSYAQSLGNVVANHSSIKSAVNVRTLVEKTITLR